MDAERVRIAALLDLPCRGKAERGASLASYLGLPKQKAKKGRPLLRAVAMLLRFDTRSFAVLALSKSTHSLIS